MASNDRLQDLYIRQTLQHLKTADLASSEVRALLTALQGEVAALLDERGPIPTATQARNEKRLKDLKAIFAVLLNETYKTSQIRIKKAMRAIIREEEKSFKTAISIGIGEFPIPYRLLLPKQMAQLVTGRVVFGDRVSGYMRKQKQNVATAFDRRIRMGMLLGESIPELVERVRGTPTGKREPKEKNGKVYMVNEFRGGIFDAPKYQTTALVRTAVNAISHQARDLINKQNDDIIKGNQVIATLDSRTTPICGALDGKAWDLNGKGINTNAPFPGSPPYHWNCRSLLAPLLKSFDELTEDKRIAKALKKAELPAKKRNSIDGLVPKSQTFNKWMKKRSDTELKQIFGAGRLNLMRKEGLKIEQLISPTLRQYSLKELQDFIVRKEEFGLDAVR